MRIARILAAAAAVLSLTFALNILVLQRDLFASRIITLLIVAGASGCLWIILSLVAMAGVSQKRKNIQALNGIIASAVFFAICVVLYAFANRWDRTWDLTQEGRAELAPQTVQVLKGLTQDVTVIGLFTKTDIRDLDIAREKTARFLERCQRLTNHLKVEFFDPQTERAKLEAMKLTYFDPNGTVVLKCGTRNKTIGLKLPNPKLEESDFTNALINVLRDSAPLVGFISGHGETELNTRDGAYFRALLDSEGYQFESVSIRTSGQGLSPSKYSALVIYGIAEGTGGDFSPEELQALDAYVSGGGRLLVLVDPQFVVGGPPVRKSLFTWLEQRFGIVVGEDLIISDPNVNKRLGEVTLLSDAAAVNQFGQINVPNVEFHGCFSQNSPITKGFDKFIDLMTARTVTLASKLPDRVAGDMILRTLPYAYAEKDLQSLAMRKMPVQDPRTEPLASLGVAVAVTMKTDTPTGDAGRTRDARLVVIGDSDFAKGDSMRNGGHLNFMLNCVAWLTEQEDIIAIRPHTKENQPIRLSESDEKILTWVSTMGVLQLVLLAGFCTYLVRRKYR
ncbi:MAG: GldG family protein [Candidatus Hydrogenedentes bacterium]|nr:GldG family protein [Candidatus Hydrogenedentota bacterium]